MIVVQIHSGLGNQLFMYAAARALARKHGTGLYLDVDTDCRNGVDHGQYVGHSFQLDKFNIDALYPGAAPAEETPAASGLGMYSALKERLRGNDLLRGAARRLRDNGIDLSRVLLKLSGQEKRFFVEERGDWGYKPHFMDLPDDTILRGCFFSYRYFDTMRDLLLRELTLKAELSAPSRAMQEQIAAAESVSLHIRRGDVVTNPEYRSWYEGVVTESYYCNAAAYFVERLRAPHFFVFSDDIDWVKANFRLPGKTTYVDHNGPARGYEDLHLMSRCRHNVTAGFSSFSWWGAYLNRNPGRIVVRTRRMNALDHLNHPDDFFPADWVIVDS
ncbi:MAG TPA: alpha-1,2-fucosyltransferase [Noviherbaspirillum sp.]|nr:alpha-1,2-fucosyltransferase [Noviherbaspirillum sp.]